MLQVHTLAVLEDNFIFVISRPSTGEAVVIDPAVSGPVLDFLKLHSLTLKSILLTHHHGDHVGGVQGLQRALGPVPALCHPGDQDRIPGATSPVNVPGPLAVLGETWQVVHLPGHTRHHVVYMAPAVDTGHPPWLFCGDVVFGCGCGKLFEGTALDLFLALQWVAALPPGTLLHCAHEYTLENAYIACRWLPDDTPLAGYITAKETQRAQGLWTVPLPLSEELAANPFFRWTDPAIQGVCGTADPLGVVATLRKWRDCPRGPFPPFHER